MKSHLIKRFDVEVKGQCHVCGEILEETEFIECRRVHYLRVKPHNCTKVYWKPSYTTLFGDEQFRIFKNLGVY